MTIRVLIADDHALVRAGFSALLHNLPDVQLVGEARNGQEALKLIERHQPDIAVLDIAMPELNGLEVTARVSKEWPAVRVLIVSMHATAEYARRAIRAGAAGYLLKDADALEFGLALRALAAGETYLSPPIAKYIVADYARQLIDQPEPYDRLTPRLREVLQLMAEGHTRQAIAERLNISVKTFDAYRSELLTQLKVQDTAGLVRYAIQHGLINLDR